MGAVWIVTKLDSCVVASESVSICTVMVCDLSYPVLM